MLHPLFGIGHIVRQYTFRKDRKLGMRMLLRVLVYFLTFLFLKSPAPVAHHQQYPRSMWASRHYRLGWQRNWWRISNSHELNDLETMPEADLEQMGL